MPEIDILENEKKLRGHYPISQDPPGLTVIRAGAGSLSLAD